jgi:DNA polymerase elongation subunit (family B)
MEHIFRIVDFNVYNAKDSSHEESTGYTGKDENNFIIQMFGVDELGKTYSLTAEGFKPFFYLLVNDTWSIKTKESFLLHLQNFIGPYYKNSITACKIIKRKKLYGFDGGKQHKFILIEFLNFNAYNKVKNLWYSDYKDGHTLLKDGYKFNNTYIKLYEANIPPLLRFFHIQDISPSGWVAISKRKAMENKDDYKTVNCDFEFTIDYKNIIPLNNKETRVPYKIMSFDIEASSSHGDFPVPIKTYKKLATNIVEYFENLKIEINPDVCKNILRKIILTAFGYEKMDQVDLVYPKKHLKTKEEVEQKCEEWLETPVRKLPKSADFNEANTIEDMFERIAKENEIKDDEDMDESDKEVSNDGVFNDTDPTFIKKCDKLKKEYSDKKATIVDIMCDKKFEREGKLNELNISLNAKFPKLEGDKCTFIGSTFMNYGKDEPHFNHCIVLNSCTDVSIENSVVESYNTEKEVLLAWQKLVQKENPDIIIGYNIFGFDYEFMFRRAEENNCVEDFLKLSRIKDEICGTKDKDTNKWKIEEMVTKIASGSHEMRYIKINGRLQVDLYNFYRRGENLNSYKLDYVAGYFIGDYVSKIDYTETSQSCIYTSNMTGLLVGSYVHFEVINNTVNYYENGKKYVVTKVDKIQKYFIIEEKITPNFEQKIRWCLAKDDVTPKDIFRMTNGNADDRSIIAKYCIQDCNLVHYLFNKSDVLTGFIEMSKICSVPINFIVMRGQGIKLTSYVAKKCREKRTLMPVIEKGDLEEAYEGATVLNPKRDLYLDNPVACVDYAGLYPSGMISENLSHDSKVWTIEYDLAGNIIEEWGEKDNNGNYIYDNLPNYQYVNIEYDTYMYVRKNPKASPQKIRCGHKLCRFVQPLTDDDEAIMPSILKELLKARKDTRKLIPLQTDDFIKNVLDQRQLGYKVTANSLYGQCGAKTSTFYEKDIAACTTAIGRKLLLYAKSIVEECYGDKICNTLNYGPVLTKAEYIYGDSVASYTPIYVKIDENVNIVTIEHLAEKYGNNNWIKCSEEGKQEKEFCELSNVETWTEKGWTKLNRVIRHELASHKKMMRILTHTGLIDVTDDHSLILKSGEEISPNDCMVGTELLHNKLEMNENENNEYVTEDEARIMGFFFTNGYCNKDCWALECKSYDVCNEYLIMCENTYTEFMWTVTYNPNKSTYTLSFIFNETTTPFINSFATNMYYNACKIIPENILNSNMKIRKAFFEGLRDASRNRQTIDEQNQISAAHICLLGSSLGYSTSLNIRKDKPNMYRITMTKLKQRKNPNAIKKINMIDYHGYVYDLTTDNHHFAGGIGNLIVHNTDSVFFTFNLQTPEGEEIRGKKALEITIELAQEAGHLASSFLKEPHELEYEKTFMPFCLLSKKRYVGIKYEKDPNKGKRNEMGIVLKRRDNAPIVKDIYGGILDILMKKQNIQEAIDFLKECLQNIVDEKYPIEKLIISKSLRSGYKNPKGTAHKVLADRITARDPGNKPGSGDRIPYVYIVCKDKKALQGEKIETPTFIAENKLKIDYSFYITNQIMKPVQQLFALILEKIWVLQKKVPKIRQYKTQVQNLQSEYVDDPEKAEDKIEVLRCKEIKSLLFDAYLIETNNEKDKMQSLTKFFTKK